MLLVVGDLHLSCRERDEYKWQMFEQITGLLRFERYDGVILLGDLATAKDRHPAELVCRLVRWLTVWERLAGEIHIVMGNHDYIDPLKPFWSFLGRIPGIYYWSKASAVVQVGSHRCMFLPHSADFSAMVRSHRKSIQDDYDCLFLHQMLDGAKTGVGHVLRGPLLEGVGNPTLVVSGDVHQPQTLGRVHYVGTPYPTMFGETHRGRVIQIPDWTSNGDKLCEKQLEHPAKLTVEATCIEDCYAAGARPGDHVRVQVRLSRNELSNWAGLREAIVVWAAASDLWLYSVVLVPTEAPKRVRIASTDTGRSSKVILDKFCTSHGIVDDAYVALGQSFVATEGDRDNADKVS